MSVREKKKKKKKKKKEQTKTTTSTTSSPSSYIFTLRSLAASRLPEPPAEPGVEGLDFCISSFLFFFV